MAFSEKYGNFKAWLKAADRTTRYGQLIIKKHKIFPKLSLNALRAVAVTEGFLSRKSWKTLSLTEKTMRERALQVYTRMNKGESLTEARNGIKISMKQLLKHLGKALFKKGRRWAIKKTNNIQRELPFYENGRAVTIVVRNQRDARRVSEYMAATKRVLRGDDTTLQPFEGEYIIDADGRERFFETNLERIFEIHDCIENQEIIPEWYRWA